MKKIVLIVTALVVVIFAQATSLPTEDGFLLKQCHLGDPAISEDWQQKLARFSDLTDNVVHSIEEATMEYNKGSSFFVFSDNGSVFQKEHAAVLAGYMRGQKGRFDYEGTGGINGGYPQAIDQKGLYLEATAKIRVPTSGSWTFCVGSREKSFTSLKIADSTGTVLSYSNDWYVQYGDETEELNFVTVDNLVADEVYDVEVLQYNGEDTSHWIEFSATAGVYSKATYDHDTFLERFTLVGLRDNSEPNIEEISASPASVVLVGDSATVELSATVVDDDGDTLIYTWSAPGEQPGAYVFSATDTAATSVQVSGVGTYTFKLQVSDGLASVYKTVEVDVSMPGGVTSYRYVGVELGDAIQYEGIHNSRYPNPPLDQFSWGSPFDNGYPRYKCAWRSTAAGDPNATEPAKVGRKYFLLDDTRENAYGLDGYIFGGNCSESDGTAIASKTVTSGVVSDDQTSVANPTPYISKFELSDNISYDWGAADYCFDDPRQPISEDVLDFHPSAYKVENVNLETFTKVATITFSSKVARYPKIRIGIPMGQSSSSPTTWRPTEIKVGKATAMKASDKQGAGELSWYFFDIDNANPGETMEISVKGGNQWNVVVLEGIVFDSIYTEANGLIVVIR